MSASPERISSVLAMSVAPYGDERVWSSPEEIGGSAAALRNR
jgi:hypothetical protein